MGDPFHNLPVPANHKTNYTMGAPYEGEKKLINRKGRKEHKGNGLRLK
jgi:hypothetical protein